MLDKFLKHLAYLHRCNDNFDGFEINMRSVSFQITPFKSNLFIQVQHKCNGNSNSFEISSSCSNPSPNQNFHLNQKISSKCNHLR